MRAGIALAAVVSLVAACGGNDPGAAKGSDDPFTIVYVVGKTGLLQNTAKAGIAGLEAGADVVNANGGINGRQVEIKIVDNQSDGAKVASLVQSEITKGDVDMLSIGVSSNEALPAAPLSTRNKVLMMTIGSNPGLNKPKEYPYVFSTVAKPAIVLQQAVSSIKAKGAKKVTAVLPGDAFGDGQSPFLAAALKEAGIDYQEVRFKPTDVDLTAPMLKAKNTGADLIYLDASGSAVPQALAARIKTGATSVPTIMGYSISASDVTILADAKALDNAELLAYDLQEYKPESEQTPARRTFIDAVKKVGAVDQTITVYGLTYDQVILTALAAKQAGSTDTEKLAEAFENLETPADPQWVTFKDCGFSAEDHFNAKMTVDDFAVIPVSETVDGQFKS
ncbi:ABC transporter substrate-binding protein [Micromonospora sp. HUAS LYJ1]|uniref:ABC transporter substrate-binding protein n=1 Tax=Micromonospora sp. HUAS LYJ1 TaxID=3061626 RepID=UPI00267147E3|nr:ABC transporter substrate-binding protein [Micromonospora sp. HUAS LYJ1]WKU03531.1 ABC transporter substrate-binding protein [Micromonospora sp. HUAS LYJ1]